MERKKKKKTNKNKPLQKDKIGDEKSVINTIKDELLEKKSQHSVSIITRHMWTLIKEIKTKQ